MASPNYVLPPWLTRQGADPAEAFVSAFRAGASVAVQKAQLAQQAEQAAMSAAIREQENQREALRSQHKIAIEQAQHQAELGIRQQSLEIAQQRAVETAKRAAMQFQNQETYRRRVAAGEDPQSVILSMGPNTVGFESALRSSAPKELFQPGPPQDVLDASGKPTGVQFYPTSRSAGTYRKKAADPDQKPTVTPIPEVDKSIVRYGDGREALVNNPKVPKDQYLVDLERLLSKTKALLVADPTDTDAKGAIPRLEAEIAKLKTSGAQPQPTPFTEGATIRNKKDGKLYKVVNGEPQLIE